MGSPMRLNIRIFIRVDENVLEKVREGELGEGSHWGMFITVDGNVLENFSMEEREWVVLVWESGWKVGELGELGE